MTREDDLEAQVLAALEERTVRGNGWLSLPSVDPIRDLPAVMRGVEKHGSLQDYTFHLTPSEGEGGLWDILITRLEDVSP